MHRCMKLLCMSTKYVPCGIYNMNLPVVIANENTGAMLYKIYYYTTLMVK